MSCKGLYRHVEERWIDCEYIYHKNNYEFWIAAFASLNLPTHACTDNCPKHLWLILLPLLGYKIFNCSYRWKLHAWANLCKQHYKLCNSILQAHMPHRTSTYHYTAKWRATTVTSFPKSSHHPNLCISRTCTSREQEKERKGMLSN